MYLGHNPTKQAQTTRSNPSPIGVRPGVGSPLARERADKNQVPPAYSHATPEGQTGGAVGRMAQRHKSLDARGTHESTSMTVRARLSSVADRRYSAQVVGRRQSPNKQRPASGLGDVGVTTQVLNTNVPGKSLHSNKQTSGAFKESLPVKPRDSRLPSSKIDSFTHEPMKVLVNDVEITPSQTEEPLVLQKRAEPPVMKQAKSQALRHGSTYRPLQVESRCLSAFAIEPVVKSVTPNQQKLKQMREVASKYNNLIARQQNRESSAGDSHRMRSIDEASGLQNDQLKEVSGDVDRRIAFSGGINMKSSAEFEKVESLLQLRQNTSNSGFHQETTIDARIIKDLIRRSGPSHRFFNDTSAAESMEEQFRDRLDSAAPLPRNEGDRVIIVEERPTVTSDEGKSPTLNIPRQPLEGTTPVRISHAQEKPTLVRQYSPYTSQKGHQIAEQVRRGLRAARSRSDDEDHQSPMYVLSQSADDIKPARMRNTISQMQLKNTQFLSGGTNQTMSPGLQKEHSRSKSDLNGGQSRIKSSQSLDPPVHVLSPQRSVQIVLRPTVSHAKDQPIHASVQVTRLEAATLRSQPDARPEVTAAIQFPATAADKSAGVLVRDQSEGLSPPPNRVKNTNSIVAKVSKGGSTSANMSQHLRDFESQSRAQMVFKLQAPLNRQSNSNFRVNVKSQVDYAASSGALVEMPIQLQGTQEFNVPAVIDANEQAAIPQGTQRRRRSMERGHMGRRQSVYLLRQKLISAAPRRQVQQLMGCGDISRNKGEFEVVAKKVPPANKSSKKILVPLNSDLSKDLDAISGERAAAMVAHFQHIRSKTENEVSIPQVSRDFNRTAGTSSQAHRSQRPRSRHIGSKDLEIDKPRRHRRVMTGLDTQGRSPLTNGRDSRAQRNQMHERVLRIPTPDITSGAQTGFATRNDTRQQNQTLLIDPNVRVLRFKGSKKSIGVTSNMLGGLDTEELAETRHDLRKLLNVGSEGSRTQGPVPASGNAESVASLIAEEATYDWHESEVNRARYSRFRQQGFQKKSSQLKKLYGHQALKITAGGAAVVNTDTVGSNNELDIVSAQCAEEPLTVMKIERTEASMERAIPQDRVVHIEARPRTGYSSRTGSTRVQKMKRPVATRGFKRKRAPPKSASILTSADVKTDYVMERPEPFKYSGQRGALRGRDVSQVLLQASNMQSVRLSQSRISKKHSAEGRHASRRQSSIEQSAVNINITQSIQARGLIAATSQGTGVGPVRESVVRMSRAASNQEQDPQPSPLSHNMCSTLDKVVSSLASGGRQLTLLAAGRASISQHTQEKEQSAGSTVGESRRVINTLGTMSRIQDHPNDAQDQLTLAQVEAGLPRSTEQTPLVRQRDDEDLHVEGMNVTGQALPPNLMQFAYGANEQASVRTDTREPGPSKQASKKKLRVVDPAIRGPKDDMRVIKSKVGSPKSNATSEGRYSRGKPKSTSGHGSKKLSFSEMPGSQQTKMRYQTNSQESAPALRDRRLSTVALGAQQVAKAASSIEACRISALGDQAASQKGGTLKRKISVFSKNQKGVIKSDTLKNTVKPRRNSYEAAKVAVEQVIRDSGTIPFSEQPAVTDSKEFPLRPGQQDSIAAKLRNWNPIIRDSGESGNAQVTLAPRNLAIEPNLATVKKAEVVISPIASKTNQAVSMVDEGRTRLRKKRSSSRVSLLVRRKESQDGKPRPETIMMIEAPEVSPPTRNPATEVQTKEQIPEQLANVLNSPPVPSVTSPVSRYSKSQAIAAVSSDGTENVKSITSITRDPTSDIAMAALKAQDLPQRFFEKVECMRKLTKVSKDQEKAYRAPMTAQGYVKLTGHERRVREMQDELFRDIEIERHRRREERRKAKQNETDAKPAAVDMVRLLERKRPVVAPKRREDYEKAILEGALNKPPANGDPTFSLTQAAVEVSMAGISNFSHTRMAARQGTEVRRGKGHHMTVMRMGHPARRSTSTRLNMMPDDSSDADLVVKTPGTSNKLSQFQAGNSNRVLSESRFKQGSQVSSNQGKLALPSKDHTSYYRNPFAIRNTQSKQSDYVEGPLRNLALQNA